MEALEILKQSKCGFQKVLNVILGTVAVENPSLVKLAASKYPGKIAVGIDARNGRVATDGWVKDTAISAPELAKKFENDGVSAVIYTDIERDGALMGPNLSATAEMANAVSIPVIASGGVSSLKDLKALRDCGAKLNGVISGELCMIINSVSSKLWMF